MKHIYALIALIIGVYIGYILGVLLSEDVPVKDADA